MPHLQVIALLEQGYNNYSAGTALKDAVDALLEAGNPTSKPGPATLMLGNGVWEVR